MATRYIPKRDFHVADKQGRHRFYRRNHLRRDGTPGYVRDEITGLYRDHLKMFDTMEVSGDSVVEQATAAPGEKRAVSHPENVCDDCGESFKTPAALGSHSRVHSGEKEE